ncbi:MAG: hypothetical protein ACQKBT_10865 [Puniceicoccales bacterium]
MRRRTLSIPSAIRAGLMLGIALISPHGMAQSQEEETFRFEFRVFGLHPGQYDGIHFINPKGEPQEIDFRRRQRSQTYEYESTLPAAPITFFRIEKNGDDNLYRPVAQITPSPSWSEMLFLFQQPPDASPDSPLTVAAADDTVQNFPFGSLRVLNLTGIPLAGSIAKQLEEISPGEWTDAFRFNKSGKVDVVFAAAGSEKFHLVYRKIIPLKNNSRTLLILRPPNRVGSIRIAASTLQEFESENP